MMARTLAEVAPEVEPLLERVEPPVDPTPVRLMDAAERLIAEQGVDRTSLRAINAAAGSNVAAAHYHFGSKEGLVSAVLLRRMDEVSRERRALMAPLEREDRPPIRSVIGALVEPFARRALADGDTYVRFLGAIYRAGDPWWNLASEAFAPQYRQFIPLLERSLPRLPQPVRSFRLRAAATTLFAVLAAPEHYWSPPLPAAGEFVEDIIDLFQSMVAGPACSHDPEEVKMPRGRPG